MNPFLAVDFAPYIIHFEMFALDWSDEAAAILKTVFSPVQYSIFVPCTKYSDVTGTSATKI